MSSGVAPLHVLKKNPHDFFFHSFRHFTLWHAGMWLCYLNTTYFFCSAERKQEIANLVPTMFIVEARIVLIIFKNNNFESNFFVNKALTNHLNIRSFLIKFSSNFLLRGYFCYFKPTKF